MKNSFQWAVDKQDPQAGLTTKQLYKDCYAGEEKFRVQQSPTLHGRQVPSLVQAT